MASKEDVFEKVTAHVVKLIESGNEGKWEKPWTQVLASSGLGVNASTNQAYKGFNQFILMATAAEEGYVIPLWATYKQWEGLGGQVKKGEAGTLLVKWGVSYVCNGCDHKGRTQCPKPGHVSDDRWWASPFYVFNIEQQEGYEFELPELPPEPERLAQVEAMIEASGADIQFKVSDEASYNRVYDRITMPLREQFPSTQALYGTLLHELTHWTAHESRLARELGKRFGDDAYAAEELIAELGATFLAARFQVELEPHTEHVAYLASWLKVLKKDPKALYVSAKHAEEAAEFLTSKVKEEVAVA